MFVFLVFSKNNIFLRGVLFSIQFISSSTKQMKKIRYCFVQLDAELKPYEITALRGAVAETVRKYNEETTLFHNHIPQNNYRQGYPLVQYKRIHGKPTIVFLEEAVDVAHYFFSNMPTDLRVHNHLISTKIDTLVMRQPTLQVWDNTFTYKIWDYAPLKYENKEKYDAMESLTERVVFLEKLLTSHIIAFAQNIKWAIHLQNRVQVRIKDIKRHRQMPYKDMQWDAFDLVFECNVSLPNYIGLGNHVSVGWGIIKNMQPQIQDIQEGEMEGF